MKPESLAEFEKLPTRNLIAPRPARPRDSSRLMVLERKTGRAKHAVFSQITSFLGKGDCLVLNNSMVMKHKIRGSKVSGGNCEILLIAPLNGEKTRWKALGKKLKKGAGIQIAGGARVISARQNGDRSYELEFSRSLDGKYLSAHGEPPLPPYISSAGKKLNLSAGKSDEEDYQTVYARIPGSVAAHTAGFHFTRDMLSNLRKKGVEIRFITLHIGWGTFRPVKTSPEKHEMLPETAAVSAQTAKALSRARKEKRRIIPVGTSTMRTLETFAGPGGTFEPGKREADIFIYPGHKFKAADAFITNFHVPGSAPLFMAAAFAGADRLFKAYEEAMEKKYRFYSYGDAMFII